MYLKCNPTLTLLDLKSWISRCKPVFPWREHRLALSHLLSINSLCCVFKGQLWQSFSASSLCPLSIFICLLFPCLKSDPFPLQNQPQGVESSQPITSFCRSHRYSLWIPAIHLPTDSPSTLCCSPWIFPEPCSKDCSPALTSKTATCPLTLFWQFSDWDQLYLILSFSFSTDTAPVLPTACHWTLFICK